MAAIRVMVVDDSVVVRRIVADVIDAEDDLHVVGTAIHGRAALEKLPQLTPDIITMDVEMPEMDGIEAVRRIRALDPTIPIIMFSTLTERSAQATFDALAAGADDYVTKPANVGSITESMTSVRAQLIPRLRALTGRSAASSPVAPAWSAPRTPWSPGSPAPAPAGGPSATPTSVTALQPFGAAAAGALPRITASLSDTAPWTMTAPPTTTAPPRTTVPPHIAAPPTRKAVRVMVVGASTGGPEALTEVLRNLPADLAVPVLVVQHMPAIFTAQFAQRLDRLCALHVVEAEASTPLVPGTIHVAPGGLHLSVVDTGAGAVTALTTDAPENFCRPAVDVLFRSAVAAYGGGVLAVVLTGMGVDGRAGAGAVRAAGGWVVAQDQATSVVWGMPGAVAQAGYADEVLPLRAVAAAALRHLPQGARR